MHTKQHSPVKPYRDIKVTTKQHVYLIDGKIVFKPRRIRHLIRTDEPVHYSSNPAK